MLQYRDLMLRKYFSSTLVAALVISASLVMPDAHALSCLPTSPLIGIVATAPRAGSGSTIVVELDPAATFHDTAVQNGLSAQQAANIDAYAVLLRSFAANAENSAVSISASSRSTMTLPASVRESAAIKVGDVIAQGPPFHICGYSLYAIADAKGSLKSIVTTRGYGSYQVNDATVAVSVRQSLACRDGSCTATVTVQNGANTAILAPGDTATFKEGPVASMKLHQSSVPDVQNPADPYLVSQRDPWGLQTYAVMSFALRQPFTPLSSDQPGNLFPDVAPTHPYAHAISIVRSLGIMTGNDDGTFRPESPLNRAELTKILVTKSHGDEVEDCVISVESGALRDVVPGAWYEKYVCVALTQELMTGYPDGTIRPGNAVNFAESTALIARAYDLPVRDDPRAWYYGYYHALEERGAVPPTVRSFEQLLTRAEIAYILARLSGEY